MPDPIHLLSLGAGVQSSTLALMAAAGEVTPMPVAAIFADTQDEPDAVYSWLEWLEKKLPFPVHRVTAGKLSARALEFRTSKQGRVYTKTDIPFHTLSASGDRGMVQNRACTADFKIIPILKKARELGGIKRGQKSVGVIQWIGISLDEIYRMKPAREPWVKNIWPLVSAGMKRHDCLRWMEARGYPVPPRSACIFCPFKSNHEWRILRDEDPAAFERAVAQAKASNESNIGKGGLLKSTMYLHRSCVPLSDVDLSTDSEHGQGLLWGNECEGMCGV